MQYNTFKYIFPPRAQTKIKPSRLHNYETSDETYLAQVKYNGCACVIFLDGQDVRVYNRHGEWIAAANSYHFKNNVDFRGIHSGTGYMVVCGELMNKAKKDEHGNKLEGFIMWDILVYGGEYMIGRTTEQRVSLLEHLFPTTRMRIAPDGTMQQYEHLSFTPLQGIYKAPVYTRYFEPLYKDVVRTDAYEGVVLKKADAQLDFGYNEVNNHQWQFKVRKATKNYTF